jgi:S-adenosylmethionine uptake transporter
MFATLDVINKKFVTNESTISMLFYSNIFTMLLSAVPAIYVWVPIDWYDIGVFVILGVVANLILYCLLKGFALVDASALAPYRYVELLFSVSLGYIFFREVPDSHIVYGAAVIILATLLVLYEGLLGRKART